MYPNLIFHAMWHPKIKSHVSGTPLLHVVQLLMVRYIQQKTRVVLAIIRMKHLAKSRLEFGPL